jgi:hypothetical protein
MKILVSRWFCLAELPAILRDIRDKRQLQVFREIEAAHNTIRPLFEQGRVVAVAEPMRCAFFARRLQKLARKVKTRGYTSALMEAHSALTVLTS